MLWAHDYRGNGTHLFLAARPDPLSSRVSIDDSVIDVSRLAGLTAQHPSARALHCSSIQRNRCRGGDKKEEGRKSRNQSMKMCEWRPTGGLILLLSYSRKEDAAVHRILMFFLQCPGPFSFAFLSVQSGIKREVFLSKIEKFDWTLRCPHFVRLPFCLSSKFSEVKFDLCVQKTNTTWIRTMHSSCVLCVSTILPISCSSSKLSGCPVISSKPQLWQQIIPMQIDPLNSRWNRWQPLEGSGWRTVGRSWTRGRATCNMPRERVAELMFRICSW